MTDIGRDPDKRRPWASSIEPFQDEAISLTQLITAATINAAVCKRSLGRAVPNVTRARRAAAAMAVNMMRAGDIIHRARSVEAQNR